MPSPHGIPADVLPHDQVYRAGGQPQLIRFPGGHEQVIMPPKRQPLLLPYYFIKPPSGTDLYFNSVTPVATPLAAGAGATVILAAAANKTPFFIRANSEGVVAAVQIFVDAPTADVDVSWTLRFNGAPVIGWDDLKTFPRVANSISIVFPGTVQVESGVTVDVLVTNNNAFGPWRVGAEVSGWQWPLNERLRVFGEEY